MPQDPFALKLKTSFTCPTCKVRPMVRETKDQGSKFLGQVRCEQCGYTNDIDSFRVLLKQEEAR